MGAISVGPFAVRVDLLALITAATISYLTLFLRLQKGEEQKRVLDAYVNALMIGLFSWKFGHLVFDPIDTLKAPLSLLYFTGGVKGVWLGVGLGGLFLGFQIKKQRFSFHALIKALVLGFLTSGLVYSIFTYVMNKPTWNQQGDLMELLQIILYGTLTLWGWTIYERSSTWILQVGFWYSAGMVFTMFFDPARKSIIFALTYLQIVFIILAFAFIGIDSGLAYNRKRKDR